MKNSALYIMSLNSLLATHDSNESYVNLSTQLFLNLGYYLDSCKVDSFKGLVELLIIDKLKSCMIPHTHEKVREIF